jgi:hypothetical protein
MQPFFFALLLSLSGDRWHFAWYLWGCFWSHVGVGSMRSASADEVSAQRETPVLKGDALLSVPSKVA